MALKEKLPRVCFVVGENSSNHCGVRDYSNRLATALTSQGIEAEVAAPVDWGTRSFLSFRSRMRERFFDVVHVQYPSIGFKWSLWPHLTGLLTANAKSVVTIHEHSALPALHRVSTHLFRMTASQIIFTTDFEACAYRKHLGSLGATQTIIPIGSNIPVCDLKMERGLTVLFFGQIRPGKGLEDFIELASLSLSKKGPFTFLIAGNVPTKHVTYYQAILSRVPSNVNWALDVTSDQAAKLLAGSLAAYLPFPDGASHRRGSMLAAMANGLPVITRAGAATSREIADNVLLAEGPREALAHLDAMFGNRRYADLKVRRAYDLAQSSSWDKIALRHSELYRSILTQGKSIDTEQVA